MDVVDKIRAVPTGAQGPFRSDVPTTPVVIEKDQRHPLIDTAAAAAIAAAARDSVRMTTLFISDLHLDASRPRDHRLFLEFLENEAAKANALYILGDLFEAWIGDDASDEVGDQVADALARLHERGVPCFYIHGNRDFLLGDAYARRARMTLLPDPCVVEIDGERVLLMHGDTLCTDDAPYQAFRAQTRASRLAARIPRAADRGASRVRRASARRKPALHAARSPTRSPTSTPEAVVSDDARSTACGA